jgi:hypothetical protein
MKIDIAAAGSILLIVVTVFVIFVAIVYTIQTWGIT